MAHRLPKRKMGGLRMAEEKYYVMMSIEYVIVVIKSSLWANKSFPVKTCFLIGIRPCWPLEEICQSCQILGLSTPCLFPIWMVITDMIITEIQISR